MGGGWTVGWLHGRLWHGLWLERSWVVPVPRNTRKLHMSFFFSSDSRARGIFPPREPFRVPGLPRTPFKFEIREPSDMRPRACHVPRSTRLVVHAGSAGIGMGRGRGAELSLCVWFGLVRWFPRRHLAVLRGGWCVLLLMGSSGFWCSSGVVLPRRTQKNTRRTPPPPVLGSCLAIVAPLFWSHMLWVRPATGVSCSRASQLVALMEISGLQHQHLSVVVVVEYR